MPYAIINILGIYEIYSLLVGFEAKKNGSNEWVEMEKKNK